MDYHLKLYTRQTIAHLYHSQIGEHKFGDTMQFFSTEKPWDEQLAEMKCRYVVFGVPEDVGVRANRGRPGADTAWPAALKTLLNMQHNQFNNGSQLALLGHLGFADEIARAHITPQTDPKDLHHIISTIDEVLTGVVKRIVELGKIPIVIGGGHNNAYGMIKGCSLALGKSINSLNIDAHTDLRPTGYRHSGNGFLYAFEENHLDRYFVFGLHENYTLQTNLNFIAAHADRIRYVSFEDMRIRRTKDVFTEAGHALDFVAQKPFGFEIDCDAISMVPSSALTPSGFTPEMVRSLAHAFGQHPNATYLHICEAAPDPNNANEMMAVGKLICALVSDFIREQT
jgi:formiminoglutamase